MRKGDYPNVSCFRRRVAHTSFACGTSGGGGGFISLPWWQTAKASRRGGKSRVKTFAAWGVPLGCSSHTHKTRPGLISSSAPRLRLPPLLAIISSLFPLSGRGMEQKVACNYILIFGCYLLCYRGCWYSELAGREGGSDARVHRSSHISLDFIQKSTRSVWEARAALWIPLLTDRRKCSKRQMGVWFFFFSFLLESIYVPLIL